MMALLINKNFDTINPSLVGREFKWNFYSFDFY